MKNRRICALAVAVVPAGVSLGAGSYNISLLPAPSDASYEEVRAVSPNGLIAGEAFIGNHDTLVGYMQPLVWQNGAVMPLSLPSGQGTSGEIRGINDSGTAVGGVWQGPIPSAVSPVVWQNGQVQALATLGMDSGEPTAINAQGVIAGTVANAAGSASSAASWSNGQATIIGNFPGQQAAAQSINNHGDVLLTVGNGSQIATYIWSNGQFTTVSGITPSTVHGADGAAMNDLGQVVGASLSGDGTIHAFLWQNGATMDLGKESDEISSQALAINASGEIVGTGYAPESGPQALLWENGQLFNLNDLVGPNSGWTLNSAVGITNDGQIVGNGLYNGQSDSFVLTPTVSPPSSATPEPATVGTLAVAAALLLRRRRQNA